MLNQNKVVSVTLEENIDIEYSNRYSHQNLFGAKRYLTEVFKVSFGNRSTESKISKSKIIKFKPGKRRQRKVKK